MRHHDSGLGEDLDFAGVALSPLDDLVFGGHDVTVSHPAERAELPTRAGVLPPGVAELVADEPAAADAEVRPGTHTDEPRPQPATVDRMAADLTDFKRRNGLHRAAAVRPG